MVLLGIRIEEVNLRILSENKNLNTLLRNSFLIYTKKHLLDSICYFRYSILVNDCNFVSLMVLKKIRLNQLLFSKPNL